MAAQRLVEPRDGLTSDLVGRPAQPEADVRHRVRRELTAETMPAEWAARTQ
jgi:hypothetical protein